MKIKNLFIGALMMVIAAPAMAQTNSNEVAEQANTLIKAGDKKGLATLAKQYKKDVNALVGIASACLVNNDMESADQYANMAETYINENPKKVTGADKANAYLVFGAIATAKDDGGAAASWYQNAVYADPKNPQGYLNYAKVTSKTDPKGSMQMLADLEKNVPDFSADLRFAQIATEAGRVADANKYYKKAYDKDPSKFSPYDLGQYAFNLYMAQDYANAAKVAAYGQTIAPRSATLNRLAFWSNTNLKNYDQALVDADKLFNQSDSVKISSIDYNQRITALRGAGKYDEALAELAKQANDPKLSAADQQYAAKQIAQTYADKKDWAKAIPAFDAYYAKVKETISWPDVTAIGGFYRTAAKANPAKKNELLTKADEVYSILAPKYEQAYYYKALVATEKANGDLAAAVPFYEKVVELDADPAYKKAALENLAYYYYAKKENGKAVDYANQLLKLDANNKTAQQIVAAGAGSAPAAEAAPAE